MLYFDNITEAGDAVNEWFWVNKNGMSESMVGVIQPLLGPTKSAVDLIVKTAEEIYKRRGDLDSSTLQLGAALSSLAGLWGFHGMDVDNRGHRIALALYRDSGETAPEGLAWPDSSQDPEIKGFAPQIVSPSE